MDEKREVGYVFNIGAQTDDGISIQVTGNLPLGVQMPDVNAELDKWAEAFYRQRAKAVLSKEEDTLAKEESTLGKLYEQLEEMGKKETLKTAEKQALTGLKQNIDRTEAQIAARKSGVESLKKLI